MKNRERVPGIPGESTTTLGVAGLVDALVLPSIEPLATDIVALSGLPVLPVPGESGPASWSQLDGVRALMDGCGDAVAALRRHQNRCAGQVAVMVERMEATAVLEGRLLSLDWWQRGCAIDQIKAELAVALQVTEGAAGRLIEHSVALVRLLPASMAELGAGVLGWEQAVVIVEETTLLRGAGVGQDGIDVFERQLLEHAGNKTLTAFRATARRIRERSHPESIPARTKRAYAERNLRVNRGSDGMSWMSLYAPSPTIEAIWDQCTYTAQAAQGAHEERTLTQLRADICAALLLRQSMAENHIHSPAPETGTTPGAPSSSGPQARAMGGSCFGPRPGAGVAASANGDGDGGVDSGCGDSLPPEWLIPVFDDPDYRAGGFVEPDPRNFPDWRPLAQVPVLVPAGTPPNLAAGAAAATPATGSPATGSPATGSPTTGSPGMGGAATGGVSGSSGGVCDGGSVVWPPLPQVIPVVLIPALSLLGQTNEPAWMVGAGPISMEVAKRLTARAGSFLRVLVDPITNKPLDRAPDRYRIDRAMRTMLQLRDEYCQFPGCMAKAVNCEVDHVKSFESGGRSIYNNLDHLCARHHLVKHYKDDKDRNGQKRCIQEPERQSLRLRGWTPCREADGRLSWTSPSGRYCPPNLAEDHAPAYPGWVKDTINASLSQHAPEEDALDQNRLDRDEPDQNGLDQDGMGGEGFEGQAPLEVLDEPVWDAEEDAILTQMAVRRALKRPWLGNADAQGNDDWPEHANAA